MKRIIKDYFSFNSRERTAIVLLCGLMGLFLVMPRFFPEKTRLPDQTAANGSAVGNTAPIRNALSGSAIPGTVSASGETATGETFASSGKKLVEGMSSTRSGKEISELTPIEFPFDPNTLSEAGWKQLGIREKTILTIRHYIEKGGRFRQPEDLKKIWGFKPEDAGRLMPYVRIDNVAPSKLSKRNNIEQPIQTPTVSYPIIHINQATEEEWKTLPGIGETLAARMVKFRNKIGGFKSVDQVAKTYGLKDSVFQLIKPFLVIDQAIAPLNN